MSFSHIKITGLGSSLGLNSPSEIILSIDALSAIMMACGRKQSAEDAVSERP